MMRLTTLIPVFLAVIFQYACKEKVSSKFFSGTIEYSYAYSSDSMNIDSLTKTRPAKSIFRYDTSGYQSLFINSDTVTYYYSGKENKCLSRNNSEDKYECEDYSVVTDSVIAYKLYDTEEKVLGYSCRILEVQKKNSWLRYHVSTDLRIAPAVYNKHVSYNWDFYGNKASGGLILRSEHRFRYFTMRGTATAVNRADGNFNALEAAEKLFSAICK
ncbi:MAG: hypothetical protein JNK14_03955 [Chitinophagaceae bacterium]|nr:hypothetical protein [Chitinophagaceae bacterium]